VGMLRSILKRSRLVAVASMLFFSAFSHALLLPGADAPDFTLNAAVGGKPFKYVLYEALKKGPVVLYFYPKAFTGGCTVQAHMFSRAIPDFTALGATVIGVSNDNIDVQSDFSKKECYNGLTVAADQDGSVIRTYDASMMFGSVTSKRATYVITPDKKVFYAYADMSPKEHVSKSLDVVRRWNASQQHH
jgi:peroxiredoxin Q/BCP